MIKIHLMKFHSYEIRINFLITIRCLFLLRSEYYYVKLLVLFYMLTTFKISNKMGLSL